ncbi:metallophosphoesterase [Psychrobacter sp. I-STPA10]|uniref:metallophosphoesterase n=1 Tax=Psychrobacter sp. I-STPA10 TaxID=2585769 RepID=UPI001E5AFE04|nr:metallophosphoesterase [Psychrobacter sp. I-STPA10]
MKIQILSDLHIDSYVRRNQPIGEIPATEADIIIVAGDTANGECGMSWLHQQAQRLQKPIFTVAGNHEYFDQDILDFDETLQQWDNFVDTPQCEDMRGVKLLQCSSVDIADIRILGCTLWTDYQYQATEDTIPSALHFMRDYKQISAGNEMFSPAISTQIHAKHRQWLLQSLQQAHTQGRECVVVTHHSVSPLSVSQKYAQLPSNAAFVSDLSAWMYADWAPKLWVHGHTHEAFDYQLGNTRVVVNPRAYPGEISSTGVYFDWAKVVSV